MRSALILVALALPAMLEARLDPASRQEAPRWWDETGTLIAADAGGPCRLITSVPPLVGWYAGCQTQLLAERPSAWLADRGAPPTYVVFGPEDRRDRGDWVAAHQGLVDSGGLVRVEGTPPDVELYRATP